MNPTIFICLWLGIPVATLIIDHLALQRVIKKQKHDQILFAFCEARDTIALKAIRGEVSEDSELFDFFYNRNARIIHNHTHLGVCFKEIERAISRNKHNADTSVHAKRLLRQLKQGDSETKQMAEKYGYAVLMVLVENSGSPVLRALPTLAYTLVAESLGKLNKFMVAVNRLFIPRQERETLSFVRQMVIAAKSVAEPVGMTSVHAGV